MGTLTPRIAALLGSCALLACANHIRYSDSEADREQRHTLARHYSMEAPEGMLAGTQLRLSFFVQEAVESRVERTVTRFEEETPYRGGRELFEVPAGLVSLPLSFGFNLVDVLLLGYIPNELVSGYTFWTFAALNPLLNTEDTARIRKQEIGSESREFQRSQENVRSALRDATIAVALDAHHEVLLSSDADGVLSVDLLRLMATVQPPVAPRRLTVVVRDPAGSEQLRRAFFIERELGLRLAKAAPLARVAVDEHASPDALAQAIFALDRLGFQQESAELQEAARERLAGLPNALGMLVRGIDTLYAANPNVEELLHTLSARFAREGESVPAARESD